METKVVNIPFVGGINEFNDPDQLQPPELVACEEAVVRQPGRIEKRHGFTLVEGASGQPATAFRDTGTVTTPSSSIEAMEAYYGQNGSRPVLAAGNKFYEFVGSDASHGWREVNRLPTYVGSLVGVTASGGSVIEVESLEDSTGTHRLTAWITGQRTGQERTSDLAYKSQAPGPGSQLYYAVQNIDTGAFIYPPQPVAGLGVSYPLCNLRVCRVEKGDGTWDALIAVQKLTSPGTPHALALIVSIQTGLSLAGVDMGPAPQYCHRAFDVVGLSGLFKADHFLFAAGEADTASDATPAKLPVTLFRFDRGAGTISAVGAGLVDAIDHTSIYANWWNPWAHRGVVFDQTLVTDGLERQVAFGARVISTRYVTAEGSKINTKVLDGQLVLGAVTVNPVTNAVTVTTHQQAYVQNIGFQTEDNHDYLFAGSVGTQHQSASVTVDQNGQLGGQIGYTSGLPSSIVVTGLVNGTIQAYSVYWASQSWYPSAVYLAQDCASIAASGLFPKPVHSYRQDKPELITYPSEQTNWVTWTNTNGYTPGVYHGCLVQDVNGNRLCTASVAVSLLGHISEFAIEDGTSDSAFAGLNSHIDIAVIVGGDNGTGGNIGAGTILGGKAFTFTPNAGSHPVVYDVPNQTVVGASASYAVPDDPQHCVHRWSVLKQRSGDGVLRVAAALSSLAANTFTTPNGAEPYGAASPHMPANFFEVYQWDVAFFTGPYPLTGPGVNYCLIGALGGPWRLVGGLQVLNDPEGAGSTIGCVISPAADEFQRNTFLVRIGRVGQARSITTPDPAGEFYNVSNYTYQTNEGMFVEAANMMRVTSMPLNVPNLVQTSRGLLTAGLRDGTAKGTQQIFAIDYEDTPQNWRRMQVFSDYTFVNGGVPSVFDGVGCNEAVPLIWPQRDFTSINYDKSPHTYQVSQSMNIKNTTAPYSELPCAFFTQWAGDSDAAPYPATNPAYVLLNITRPYFKYEAGFKDPNGYKAWDDVTGLGNAWKKIATTWGGDPSLNYESVYSDPRYSQLNAVGKAKYNAGMNQAGEFKQHYYGRYHANVCDYSSNAPNPSLVIGSYPGGSWWVWAPRSAQGWGDDGIFGARPGFGSKSLYNPADAGGDFLIRWTYEYIDGTGRIMRSCPSNAVQYTVCAEILGGFKIKPSDAPEYYGGVVSVFEYGFFAPRLELTNRLKTAANDPRHIVLQPYTTAEPFSTVLYRMPFSSFANTSSAFVVDRNVTRGVIPYVDRCLDGKTPATSDYPLGFATSNLTVFDGPTKDFNGLLSEPYLYTTGGVLDNVAPPGAKSMCMHQNRLVLGGADDQTVVWYSKPITPTDSVAFNDALTITIGDGGPVMGLASLNGNLIVFKYADIYVVPGTFPDATGYGPSLGEPFNLPAGVGCIDHRSVCETPIGVFFRSTRGLELLTPQLDVVPMTKVRSTIDLYPNVTSVIHYPTNREVWFMCHDSLVSSLHAHPSAVMLVYNYQTETWSTFKSPTQVDRLGRGMFAMCLVTETAWMAGASDSTFGQNTVFAYTYDTSVYYDTSRDSTKRYIPVTVKTAPISLNNVQGFQRIKRVRLLANPTPPDGTASEYGAVNVGLATDYVAGGTQSASWTKTQLDSVLTAQGRFQLEVHVAEQKGQRLQLTYSETAPVGGVAASGFGFALSNIALVVGLKAGLDKRILPEAKH